MSATNKGKPALRDDLEQLVQAVMKQPGFMRNIGAELAHLAPGDVELRLDAGDHVRQFTGAVHGGVVTALADHAAGAAVTTMLPAGQIAVTTELKINFLSQAKAPTLLAHAQVEKTGRSVCVATVDVFAGSTREADKCALAIVTLAPIPFQTGSAT